MSSVEILFQTSWKMFSVLILSLHNILKCTACQEKGRSSRVFRTACGGLPVSSPSQAESCGVSPIQDKPTFPLYIKPNLLDNKSVDVELASWNQMAVLIFPGLAVFFCCSFWGFDQSPTWYHCCACSVLLEMVDTGHFLLGKWFSFGHPASTSELWYLELGLVLLFV